jgi:AMIN domain
LSSARAQWCVISAALAVMLAAAPYVVAQEADAPAQDQSPATQVKPSKRPRADVRSVTVTSDDFGPVIEILATHPLTPQIQTVENPLRLVIDLPDSNLSTPKRRIPFRNEQIKSIRLNQYQTEPAVSRIVVDLAGPVRYTWDASGTRLRIRIRGNQAATAKPPSVPALTAGVQPAAVPVAIGSSGTLVETGSRVASGSSITAGAETAIMRLTRGGEVRVCPGTTVSFTTSSSGNDLMLGMSQGAIETNYLLQESVDSVLTPDFRIVLPGPGEFNLAIRADSHGNTCVGSLPGSTSSAVVAELLGSGTYEIKPEQQVLFRQGRLDSIETPTSSCGCPAPQEPVMRTENNPSAIIPDTKAGEKLELARSESTRSASAGNAESSVDPSTKPDNKRTHTENEADAPLVFSGLERAKARHNAPPPPVDEVAALHLTTKPPDPPAAVVVLPPAPDPKSTKKGFFGKVKGFFGSIFH